LNRGEEGELHVGGPQVISGCLDAGNDVFYLDGKYRWIITGDMAPIDDCGAVHIIGRYKNSSSVAGRTSPQQELKDV
jgi:non-ribosomal peptide synthetase component E (peptide arylation enzyme)